MKTRIAGALSLLLTLYSLQSFAQDKKIPINEPDLSKPKLFSDLPQKMSLRLGNAETLFNYELGASVNVSMTDNFTLVGVVVSKSDSPDPRVQSIVVRCTNRLGATFTFSKTLDGAGKLLYIGRMLSRNNGDAYEIVRENDQYIMQKKNLYDMISE